MPRAAANPLDRHISPLRLQDMKNTKYLQVVTAAGVATAASFAIVALITGNSMLGSASLGSAGVSALIAILQPDRE
jgi:hypothetical protein